MAFAAFDPATVMMAHGQYTGVDGWFGVDGSRPDGLPRTRIGGAAHRA